MQRPEVGNQFKGIYFATEFFEGVDDEEGRQSGLSGGDVEES